MLHAYYNLYLLCGFLYQLGLLRANVRKYICRNEDRKCR